MRTSVVVLCAILLSGTTFGDEKKPVPGEKRMPVEPDKAGIEYLRDIRGNVTIALRPQAPHMPMDVDVQVRNGEVTVVGWMRTRGKRQENTCFTIALKNPKTLAVTGVQMVAADAKRYSFTDSFGYRYLLVSGPSLEKSPAMPLVGTLEWREESGTLVTFTEPSVGLLQVTREWMRYPRKCCPAQDAPKKDNPVLPVLPPDYVKVEAFGTLKVGILAIGGETTGYAVTANEQTWELDFHKDDNLIQWAKKLDGQKVWVRGGIDFRRYVERNIVNTILVEDLRDASYVLPKKKS